MANKKTTITEIARALAITPSAVSKALNNHPRISDTTKEAVAAMAKKMNYQPNHLASALRKGKSNLLGVVIPMANISFFSSVVKGVEDVVNAEGYNVIISQSHDSFEKECTNIEALLKTQVDGIIASIGNETTDLQHYENVKEKGVPLIFFDRVDESLGVDTIIIDDYLGAFRAAEHLIDQGCKRIAHIGGHKHVPLYHNRIKGYLEALRTHHLPIEEELIWESGLEIKDGREITEKLLALSNPPDAIFASSDYSALGAQQLLLEQGINIPDEIAIIGFSNEPFTSYVTPSLSTVNQHSEQMGQRAAKIFLERMASKNKTDFMQNQTVLTPELIIRDSSRRGT
ncbi:LacI family DNA-binding transcriptional regulator [Fulvivirgaceae bacterium BMA10]|uniref:LacI family DNA-binding transcriptional regulator n=1 Tax=Splendidivirga corallicola TaxID=3051826 RepID=A0ABT8KN15_9BACT|nr:LacI family DNA-binding transcriptional regulator [Fulvivirgaceae bacterium BMA10]